MDGEDAVSPDLNRLPIRGSQLKPFELKTRCHRASDKRPGSERFGCLPRACRYGRLWALTVREVDPEPDGQHRLAVHCDAKIERRAGMKMPDLHCVETMPVRALPGLQQEIDCGRARTPVWSGRVAERFAKMSAFQMWLKSEPANDLIRRESRERQWITVEAIIP